MKTKVVSTVGQETSPVRRAGGNLAGSGFKHREAKMRKSHLRKDSLVIAFAILTGAAISFALAATTINGTTIGREVAVPVHLEDGQEFELSISDLIAFGRKLFLARWTIQEGQGRPLTKGTGAPLSDPSSALVFPKNFNRISGPDTGSCAGCHNNPEPGGGGDIVANVFVLGQRFDFATFDRSDNLPTGGAVDETGNPVTLQTIADSRKTIGMFGSGFVEMLARQMTADLETIRDATPPGRSAALVSKGVSFGTIIHKADGTWDITKCEGLPAPSVSTNSPSGKPSLIIHPLHQAGAVISLRQFTNNAFNHHHGIQSEERFGLDVDADGDGFVNELTRADVTAATLFQATLQVPGRVVAKNPVVRAAVVNGEQLFNSIGCANCHIPTLPLTNRGWIYTEPNPYNPPGNLRPSDGVPAIKVDLTSNELPRPRLRVSSGVVMVPAYTDLKLHDITAGLPSCASHPDLIATHQCDANVEALDMNEPAGSLGFFAGNSKFITRKLWGIANQHPFGHHGQYTTLREAVEAHSGEALFSRMNFDGLTDYQRDSIIEFLKSLQILPAGTPCLIVDEKMECTNVPEMLP